MLDSPQIKRLHQGLKRSLCFPTLRFSAMPAGRSGGQEGHSPDDSISSMTLWSYGEAAQVMKPD